MDGGRLYSGSPQSPDQRRELCHPQSSETRYRATEDDKNGGSSVSSPTPDLSVSETAAVCWGVLALLSPISDSFWIVTHNSVCLDLPPGEL